MRMLLSDETNFAILTKGLGKYRKQTVKTVGIVGAGMAGLVAARLLKQAGLHVKLFEANHRVGGRIKTLREGFTHGLYAEAGAMRIPDGHKLTIALCDQFRCERFPFIEECDNAPIYLNGYRCTRGDYKAGLAKFNRSGPEQKPATDYIKHVLAPIIPIYREGGLTGTFSNEHFRKLDTISWGDYLHAFVDDSSRGRSSQARNPITREKISAEQRFDWSVLDLIRFEFGAADFRASLLEFMREHETIGMELKHQIKGGMDMLPTGFVDPLRVDPHNTDRYCLADDILYHARVKEIKRHEAKFSIEYEHTLTHGSDALDVDYVILAAPFSALTHVRLTEALPPEYRHAIRTLHYENAAKIILEFSERFWEAKGIIGGKGFTDLPIRWTHYPSPKQLGDNKRGILLASYTWGDDSLRWGPLSEEDRVRFALRDIADLHGGNYHDYSRTLVGGMSHNWARDEYTFGAFAIFEPHQETELLEMISAPHKNVHFAGEHASLKHAWIEGAVESGIRTAKEVFDAA